MKKKRSPKFARTEVTWRSEDTTRTALAKLNYRVVVLERIIKRLQAVGK